MTTSSEAIVVLDPTDPMTRMPHLRIAVVPDRVEADLVSVDDERSMMEPRS